MPIPQHIKEKILKKDPSIREIELNNVGLFDEDIYELCDLLLQNTYITSVNLHHNNMGNKGAIALATRCKHLTKLTLNSNNVGDEAVEYLVRHESLVHLDLGWNSVTDVGAKTLSEHSRCLSLNLAGNSGISDQWLTAVSERIKANNEIAEKGSEQSGSGFPQLGMWKAFSSLNLEEQFSLSCQGDSVQLTLPISMINHRLILFLLPFQKNPEVNILLQELKKRYSQKLDQPT